MEAATPSSWKTRPLPEQRELVAFAREFNAAELALLQLGLIPQEMEDKWFIYLAENVLHFHRSWTGNEIYRLPLTPTPDGGATASAFWVNRNPAEYTNIGVGYDQQALAFMIDHMLLDRPAAFPTPDGHSPE